MPGTQPGYGGTMGKGAGNTGTCGGAAGIGAGAAGMAGACGMFWTAGMEPPWNPWVGSSSGGGGSGACCSVGNNGMNLPG
jgi:hypothetical protein